MATKKVAKKPIKAIKKIASKTKTHMNRGTKTLKNNDKNKKNCYPEHRAVRDFYPSDLGKCRAALTALLNRLNYNFSDLEIKRIRAQVYTVRTISEIILQEKELEIEARVAELEQELKAKLFENNSHA